MSSIYDNHVNYLISLFKLRIKGRYFPLPNVGFPWIGSIGLMLAAARGAAHQGGAAHGQAAVGDLIQAPNAGGAFLQRLQRRGGNFFLRFCHRYSPNEVIRDYAAYTAISVPTGFWSLFGRVKSPKQSSSRSQFFSQVEKIEKLGRKVNFPQSSGILIPHK